MPRKSNTIEFIEKSKLVHGDKYDYSLVEYKNNSIKVKISCSEHGVFEQSPYHHNLGSQGCPKCIGRNKTTNEFINGAKKIHGNRYDYSLTEYIGCSEKIKIICSKHGIFEQNSANHLNGYGCPECANKNVTTNKFIEKAKLVHSEKYDYSLVEYKNSKLKIEIICTIHGIFEQIPNCHLDGQGCPKCRYETLKTKFSSTAEEFVIKANKIHANKYDYSLVNYLNNHTKVKIICPVHGAFEQIPNTHLSGGGCSQCINSKGEREIRMLLEKNHIKYIQEKKFDNCKDKTQLPFDFYLPDFNFLIEYDGIQHFKSIPYFGGKAAFILRQKRDAIKTEYAKANGIKLFRIAYNENIEEKLKEIFEMELVA